MNEGKQRVIDIAAEKAKLLDQIERLCRLRGQHDQTMRCEAIKILFEARPDADEWKNATDWFVDDCVRRLMAMHQMILKFEQMQAFQQKREDARQPVKH